jgi:hypothetical protein
MGPIRPTTEKSGRRFLQDLATTICKECHAEWQWDETAQPDYYRLSVSNDKTSITFQIEGETLRDQHGDAFRDFCIEVLRRCLKTFRSDDNVR